MFQNPGNEWKLVLAACRYGYIDLQRYAWGSLMKNQFNGDRDVPVSSFQ